MHVDEALKKFAECGDASERKTVIIETEIAPVAPPARTVQAAMRKKADARGSRDTDNFQAVARQLSALRVTVTSLEEVGSMVTKLTPEQLRQVMSWSGVAAIRASQTHRKIRGSES